jgi:hypothetical protein
MKILRFALVLSTLLCSACAVTTGPYGTSVAIVPALPLVVELEDPYYVHGGYHYYYNNDLWFYSQSRGGPWVNLPRDRYPKEIRHKGKGHDRGQNKGHDRN